jgi:hypothetical protein
VHGEPRSTEDVDIVADIRPLHVEGLVSRLGESFYYPERQLREAVRGATSFSVIHLASVRKVDVFVVGSEPLRQNEIERRQPVAIGRHAAGPLFVASPEDVVLQKLLWYRKGDETSDRQWRDILGILKVQADRLDRTYLRAWAERTGTADLLSRAFRQTGLEALE